MNHSFNVDVAVEYGINVAIFLENLNYWTAYNSANQFNYHDGRFWVYNTQKSFTQLFPYLSRQEIRTTISKCISNGLIITSRYNKAAYDKTTWYSLTDKALSIYGTKISYPQDHDLDDNSWEENDNFFNDEETQSPCGVQKINPVEPASELIGCQQPLDGLVATTPLVASNQAIPNIVSLQNTLLKTFIGVPASQHNFEKFWFLYPSKKAKKKCLEIWKRKKLDFESDLIMKNLQEQVEKDISWIKGFIPNPATYLNQERWNDEITIDKSKTVVKQQENKQDSISHSMLAIYSNFVNELKAMIRFKEVPSDIKIPIFKEWRDSLNYIDARSFGKTLCS